MTKPSASDIAHEPKAMLSELESIKELLFDEDEFEECDIPVLDHTVISEDLTVTSSRKEATADLLSVEAQQLHPEVESASEDQDSEEHDSTDTELLAIEQPIESDEPSLPIDQPSLFQDPSTALNHRQQSVKAHGENPFLPKHIRDRLQGNRGASSNITQPLPVQLEVDQILDEIISQFLPAIETKLRARLKPVIDRQLSEFDIKNEPL